MSSAHWDGTGRQAKERIHSEQAAYACGNQILGNDENGNQDNHHDKRAPAFLERFYIGLKTD